MPKKLILHLGLHKTATTSLQNFLSGNSKALIAQGVAYPRLNRMRSDITPLISSFGRRDRMALGKLVEKFRKPVLLLSDENIIGSAGDIHGGALYPYAENRVRRLCEHFSGKEIGIFITLRAPAPFLVSMYCEFLRHNPYLSFETYARGFDIARFSYAETFEWVRWLPKNAHVTFTPFEAEHGGGVRRIAGDLIAAAAGPDHGIDLAAFPSARSRSSYSAEELGLAADIAARADPKSAQLFLNMIDARDRRFGATRFDPLPPDLRADLDATYARDLDRLRA